MHLIHHTSGVRDCIVLTSLAGSRSEDFYSSHEVPDAINRQRGLDFTPGGGEWAECRARVKCRIIPGID